MFGVPPPPHVVPAGHGSHVAMPPHSIGMVASAVLAPVPLTPLTATLVHSGFAHLFLNLLIFLFCGRAVETILG